MNIIASWMYTSSKNENIHHPQTGSSSGSQKLQNLYWRCALLLFESSHRLNPTARHILFINKAPPSRINGIPIDALVRKYNIELIKLRSVTKSPPHYYKSWNTQFIVLDILEQLASLVNNNDNVFILDNDIIFNRPLNDSLAVDLKTYKALLYSIDYPKNHVINGLTRLELLEISKNMHNAFPSNEFIYSGGEFICCLGSEISKISRIARDAYLSSLERHSYGASKFNEEAHLLSYTYHILGYKTYTANKYIKRIWTDRSIFSNIDGGESDLILWHLPAEKKRGFIKVFKSYKKIDGEYRLTTRDFEKVYRIEETYTSRAARYVKQGINPMYQVLKNVTGRSP